MKARQPPQVIGHTAALNLLGALNLCMHAAGCSSSSRLFENRSDCKQQKTYQANRTPSQPIAAASSPSSSLRVVLGSVEDNKMRLKESSKCIGFRHRTTLKSLWFDCWWRPPRVRAKLSSMSVDQMQPNDGMRSRRSTTSGDDKVRKLCEKGRLEEALDVVKLMVKQNRSASFHAYVWLLKCCARNKALAEGKQVHALMVQTGCDSNIFLSNNLVDMYSKCGSVLDAHEVFTKMPQHNVFSWTAIISAYADSGQNEEAIKLFHQMQETGLAADEVVFVIILKACATTASLEQGRNLHSEVRKRGFESNVFVQSTLVDMYAKCGCVDDARELFDTICGRNVILWNAMIQGYLQNGLGEEALALYKRMKQEGVQPDKVTFVVALKACASTAALKQGKQLHSEVRKRGFETDITIQNTMLDMYSKSGSLIDARDLFNTMRARSMVSWNAMIQGYVQNGHGAEALSLYEKMKQEGVQPDKVTYLIILKAYASLAALEQGKQLHIEIKKGGLESDATLKCGLIDMYAKCGYLEHAREVFNICERDVICWNAMIQGYVQNGLGKEALALYERMKEEGVQPNKVTFISILSACSHSGLVEEGRYVFDSMCHKHNVTPNLEHYSCMVDLLARSGCLAEAEDLILKMPIHPNIVVWTSLLGGARNYSDVEVGKLAFDHIVKLEPKIVSPYLLLLDIYATA